MPVHQWMIKHIFIPIKAKWGKRWLGILVCFGISAVFHEILIAVPLHGIKGYAFWGMIGQVRQLPPPTPSPPLTKTPPLLSLFLCGISHLPLLYIFRI